MKSDGWMVGIFLIGMTGLSVLAYSAGVGLSGVNTPGVTTDSPAGTVDGSALFAANCAGCHGAQAQGAVGPKLAGVTKTWTAAAFGHAILDGQAPEGRALAPMMPRFKTAGFDGQPPSDAQVTALFHFIQGL